jgi:hypothetical protein
MLAKRSINVIHLERFIRHTTSSEAALTEECPKRIEGGRNERWGD